MKRWVFGACFLLIAGAGLFYGLAADRPARKVVCTGSSTVAPLMVEIGRRFEKQHPEVRVDVQTGGSSRGLSDLRRGLNDIGMVSRSPGAGESDLHWFQVARDGIGIIVHSSNPIAELSEDEIVRIYTGRVTNWGEVGGDAGPITVVNKAEGRSTLEVFLAHFGLRNSAIEADVVIGDNQQAIKTVAGNPSAIGYVSIGAAEYEARRGAAIRLLPTAGIAATTEAVATGRYPVVRTLHLVTGSKPKGAVRALIDFARSEAVRDLVEEQFLVPNDR